MSFGWCDGGFICHPRMGKWAILRRPRLFLYLMHVVSPVVPPHPSKDFSPDFPREAIPNFQKELMHFRMMPDGKELVLETLLEFRHFEAASDTAFKDNLGAPPLLGPNEDGAASSGNVDNDEHVCAHDTEGRTRRGSVDTTVSENSNKRTQKQLKYSQIRWIGEFYFVLSSVIRMSSYLYPFFR